MANTIPIVPVQLVTAIKEIIYLCFKQDATTYKVNATNMLDYIFDHTVTRKLGDLISRTKNFVDNSSILVELSGTYQSYYTNFVNAIHGFNSTDIATILDDYSSVMNNKVANPQNAINNIEYFVDIILNS